MKVAFITGGGRGIGREITLAFARESLAVAVAARTKSQVDDTAAAARALGAGAVAVALDVADAAAIPGAVKAAAQALGPIDVLVNNAGIAGSAPFLKIDPEVWERHLRVNVTGPFLLTREVLPGMLERGWGRVINVASLAGLFGAPYIAAYATSKHALVGLTRALAMEVSGKGVTVNALCPGYVATGVAFEGARNVAAKTGRTFEESLEAMARINPSGRLIEPSEVAAAAVKLLRDDATNGEAIILA